MKRFWWPAVIGTALVGLAVSGVLVWQALGGAAAVCSLDGGCGVVQASAYASIGPVPLPLLGFAHFASILGLLAIGGRGRRLARLAAFAGGAAGLALIGVQLFVIGAICPWCVAADASALALAGLFVRPTAMAPRHSRAAIGIAALAATVAVMIAVLLASGRAPTGVAPTVSDDGAALTIVEFVDFQCPHCRALHDVLSGLIAEYGDAIRVQRHHVPLPVHALAEGAARAACCAEKAGAADAMADRLFAATDLRPAACAAIAADLHIDIPAFETCLSSPQTDARLVADLEAAREAGVRVLPTTFIDGERFDGARDRDELRASIERALARR